MNFILYCFAIAAAVVGLCDNVCSTRLAPLAELNDGNLMPRLGLGTWLGFTYKEEDAAAVEDAVEVAIDAGYRHIDTARIYSTEIQVGRAVSKKIKEGVVKREDLFITTKLWNNHHEKDKVVPGLKESLAALGMTYVDLYLIHWPVAFYENDTLSDTDYMEAWQGLVEAQKLGLTKSIGISNFNLDQMQRLLKESSVKPAVLQVEINLNLQQPELLEFCREHNIAVTAYTPFGSLFGARYRPEQPPAPQLTEPALQEIARKYNKTVTQVVLRYLFELDLTPLPKSVTKTRIEENFDIFDFQLSQDELELMKSYDHGFRTIVIDAWSSSPYYPFKKDVLY